jgi:hypothetical protein
VPELLAGDPSPALARGSGTNFAAGRAFSILSTPSLDFCGSVLAAGALFDAILCCDRRGESGKGTLERAVRVNG